MDGIHTSGSQSDENRMMGIKDINSGQYTGTISKLLNNVGLSLKTLVQSGSTDFESNAKLSGNTLGYLWEPSTNVMGVKLNLFLKKSARALSLKLI